MNFKGNQEHQATLLEKSANQDTYFHPVTVAIGHRVKTAEGKLVPQPTHSAADHRVFESLDDLAAALTAHEIALPANPTDADRKAVKNGVPYLVLGGLKNGGSPATLNARESSDPANDIYRRKSGNIGPSAIIPFDIDYCSRGIFEALTGGEMAEFSEVASVLDEYSAIVYTSPSHTADAPRFRILIQCIRPIEPEQKGTVCRQVERELMRAIGAKPLPPVVEENGKVTARPGEYQRNGDVIKFDARVYIDNQVLYCPPNNGIVLMYDGAPVDPEALPALSPDELNAARSVGKQVNGTAPESLSDAAQWMLDAGLAEAHDAKTLNILCAWHHEHGDGGGEINNGTVFKMDTDPRAERFHCSHNSCKHRLEGEPGVMLAYALEMGMPMNIAQAAWGNVASVDEFEVIEDEAGELVAAGTVTPNPKLHKFADSELATIILKHLPGTAFDLETSVFYRYEPKASEPGAGTWQIWNENKLAAFVATTFELYGSPYNMNKVSSVVKAIRLKAKRLKAPKMDLIGFLNGVYNVKAETFSPHAPDNWLTVTNGITWTPAQDGETFEAAAPTFYNFLRFACYDDPKKIRSLKALFYAVLTNRYEWQRFYELTGPGGSGKGTAMLICELLAGKENAVSIDAKDLDSSRGREPIANAKLITLPDQPQYNGDGNGLRAITGGDSVPIDPKHKQPYSKVIRAVVLAVNNSPMIFTERNGGIMRRRTIFKLDRVVPEEARDRSLMDKIGAELPAIVRGLLATFPQGKGAEAALIEQMNSADAVEIKTETDPLTHFGSMLNYSKHADGLALGVANAVSNELFHPEEFAVYPAYQIYCNAVGTRPLGLVAFRNAMKQAAAVHGGNFFTGSRRDIKGTKSKITPTNITFKPELLEYVPHCLGEAGNYDDLGVDAA
ncbi:DUF5906 domain-containing protein [Atlantibacter hermannii]|uniref:DNA primase family protein n=1 Tax=Atlantibacter hermannii TaxID=565 RepID=UPI0032569583